MKYPNISEKIIETDHEYLEEYSKICSLLLARGKFVKKMAREERIDSWDYNETLFILNEKIKRLSKKIKQKDGIFWKRVKRSLDEGRHLFFEEMALRFKLGHFEKKITLLFLHSEFYRFDRGELGLQDVINIYDLAESLTDRIIIADYFSDDSPLIKNKILKKEGHFRNSEESFCLSDMARRIVTKALNGEKVDWDKEEKRHSKSGAGSNDVGHEKSPEHILDNVIIEEEIKGRIKLFLDALKDGKLEKTGVHQKIKNSKGLSFLFYGPPGTGKSMLAEAAASYINKKVLVVEYPKITSMWHGETDKNIMKIFETAKEKDLVLVMNEADSLLCNRNYALQDHDIRFVNIMLNQLEIFEGIVILTTNMDVLLDHALERRMALKVKFKMPDARMRSEIWKSHIPQKMKLSQDVDFNSLGNKYEFSGGNIKNAVLNTVRRVVVKKQDTLTMDDFIFGAELENEGMFFYNNNRRRRIEGFSQ